MILLDTSVLIRYLRTASPSIRQVFEAADCAICGVTRAEILHGAKTSQDAIDLSQALDIFTQLPTPEPAWNQLGHHLASLRAKGLPLPFQDVLLATLAIEHNADLWSYDAHFQLIRNVLPNLKLFDGPTG